MNLAFKNGSAGATKIPLLMFSNLPVRGGAEEHLLMLLRYLDRRLFTLHLVCHSNVADSIAADLPSDVELFSLRFTQFSDVSGAFQLRRILREKGIGILHSHMFWSSMFASPVGRWAGVPVIIETPHVREQWRRGWKASYRIDRVVGGFVDRFIAVSHANARYLVEEKKLRGEQITVIQNGCDLSRFRRDHKPPANMKSELGFHQQDPVLLVNARLHEQKGHRVLLDAMPAVLGEFPNAKLVCLGEGHLRGALEQQIAALNLGASVKLVGYHSNVADWLALVDIVVLPSFYEGLPLVAIEALAAGKPVIATAVDGTPEVIRANETGLLVTAGQSDELAKAIIMLLRDSALGDRLASAGHDFVRRQFTRERQVRETEECYLTEWNRKTGEHRQMPASKPASELEAVAH